MKPYLLCCAVSCVFFTSACDGGSLRDAALADVAMPRSPLPVVARIIANDSFYVSGIAQTGCSLIVVGGEWGTIARIDPDGKLDTVLRRVPGAGPGTRLESGDGGRVLFWSNNPPSWGVLQPDLAVESMTVPVHAWGEAMSGPVFALHGQYVMVPFGDLRVRRAAPRPWVPAPLAYVLAMDGGEKSRIGRITDQGGEFLSWAAARVAVGVRGDTLVLLNLTDGSLMGWVAQHDSPAWTDTLPKYFENPKPREEVWRYPWVHLGGARVNLIGALQVEMAAIAEDGSILAVRNYGIRWRSLKLPRYFKIKGGWEVTSRGLERYTSHGDLVGHFVLPDGDLNWIRAGRNGRVFLGYSDEVIVAEFGGTPGDCPPLPERVVLDINDRPPAE